MALPHAIRWLREIVAEQISWQRGKLSELGERKGAAEDQLKRELHAPQEGVVHPHWWSRVAGRANSAGRSVTALDNMLLRALFVLALTSGPAIALELDLPIACTLGGDCFIQQYVDRDPGPAARDYSCGAQTYDGHDGIDIRLRTTADVEKGIAVLAAAPGVVVALRDGMADLLVRIDENRAAVANRQCGNGVRIDHGEGWYTQYCHMRQGSVIVKKGERVAAGTKLGVVGYSGEAAFPHVHLQVTKNGTVVDPFLPDLSAPCGTQRQALWSTSASSALNYQRGTVLGIGLTDHAITLEELETGAYAAPNRFTPVVAYMWAINLEKGDVIDIELIRDGKNVVRNSETLERNKAQFMLFTGKKAPPGGWPKGTYAAAVKITRLGASVINEYKAMTLD